MADKYVKNPVTIEAVRFPLHDPSKLLSPHSVGDYAPRLLSEIAAAIEWATKACIEGGHGQGIVVDETDVKATGVRTQTLIITNKNGARYFVEPGDWILKGVDGQVYPCKHNVFIESHTPEQDVTQAQLGNGEAGFAGTIKSSYGVCEEHRVKDLNILPFTCSLQFSDGRGKTHAGYQFRAIPNDPTKHEGWARAHVLLTETLIKAAVKSSQFLSINPFEIGVQNIDGTHAYAKDGDYVLTVNDRIFVMPMDKFDSLFNKLGTASTEA